MLLAVANLMNPQHALALHYYPWNLLLHFQRKKDKSEFQITSLINY